MYRRWFAIAAGDPGSWSGRLKLASSSPVPPSGGLSMMISVRESGIPMTVSRNRPSRKVRPSTSKPSSTKNAATESRSATVMPTWRNGTWSNPPELVRYSQSTRQKAECLPRAISKPRASEDRSQESQRICLS